MKVVNSTQILKLIENDIQTNRYRKEDLLLCCALNMMDVIVKDQPEQLLIVCGNNDNGNIGLLLADLLVRKTNIKVRVSHFNISLSNYSRLVIEDQIEVITDLRYLRDNLPKEKYIVDCLFGIENNEPIYYPFTYLIGWINSCNAKKISCDIPSGMNIDNGTDYGCCIKADKTVCMHLPKLGFYLYPASENVGELVVLPTLISKEAELENELPYSTHNLAQIKEMLPVRKSHSHKSSYGKVLLIAGCKQTAGACLLCGKAILKTGAGLLTIMSHKEVLPVINNQFPEAMTIEIDEYNVYYQISQMDFNNYSLIVIGPGLGRYSETEALLQAALRSNQPVVIDADGLFYLKKNMDLLNREALTVITPHLGEYQRIFDYNSKTIIEDLAKINQKYPNLAVVLKGEHTLVAYKGEITINTTGNNALAKGGSGDVLAGVVGGLLAQKNDIESVIAAVYIHSLAADEYIIDHSVYSLLASDLIEMIDKVFLKLIRFEPTE